MVAKTPRNDYRPRTKRLPRAGVGPFQQQTTSTPGKLFALTLASISLVGPLAVHLFMPAIPAVKAGLGLSDSLAQLTFSVALFGMAFANLFYGTLADRYGRRPMLLSGLGLFLLGSIVSLVADSVWVLVVGRLLQAIGAGCGVTLVRAIASDVYGRAALAKAIAYLTMFYTLGPMLSPLIGGVVVDTFGWRGVRFRASGERPYLFERLRSCVRDRFVEPARAARNAAPKLHRTLRRAALHVIRISNRI